MAKTISSYQRLNSHLSANPHITSNNQEINTAEKIIEKTVNDVKYQDLQCGFKVIHARKTAFGFVLLIVVMDKKFNRDANNYNKFMV